jgi:hypothetical protein
MQLFYLPYLAFIYLAYGNSYLDLLLCRAMTKLENLEKGPILDFLPNFFRRDKKLIEKSLANLNSDDRQFNVSSMIDADFEPNFKELTAMESPQSAASDLARNILAHDACIAFLDKLITGSTDLLKEADRFSTQESFDDFICEGYSATISKLANVYEKAISAEARKDYRIVLESFRDNLFTSIDSLLRPLKMLESLFNVG